MSHNEIMILIEDTMLELCSGHYDWTEVNDELTRYLEDAREIFDPELEYSPMLAAYFKLMGITRSTSYSPSNPLFLDEDDFLDYCDDLKDQHDDFMRKHHRQRSRNLKTLRESFDNLLDRHCKLLLVRVDISYGYETNTSIWQFDADLRMLRSRIQNKDTCFRHMLGYHWAIEQGREKGYHCHLLFIYNGSQRMKDGYYGDRIGDLWQEITQGDGCYFNCNRSAHKENYRRQQTLGIGMIHRNRQQEVANAIQAIRYLAHRDKEDQHLRARIPRMRCFG